MAVTKTRTVAAMWAVQDPDSRSHNGALYFKGSRIFSYGPHHLIGRIYPLGEFRPDGGGYSFVLINSDKVSVTTSKHTGICAGMAAQQYGGAAVFYVPNLTDNDLLIDPRPPFTVKENMARLRAVYPDVAAGLAQAFAQ